MSADLIGDDACREAFNKARQQRFSVHGLDVVCEPDIFRAGYAAGRDSEIAKRDARMAELEKELQASATAVENCELFRAELSAIKAQEPLTVEFMQFMTAVVTGAGLLSRGKQSKGLASELSATAYKYMLGAQVSGYQQKPIGYRCWFNKEPKNIMVEWGKSLPSDMNPSATYQELYAAPVSEAKSQGVVMPEPDIKTGHGYPAYSVAAVTELFARLYAAPAAPAADGWIPVGERLPEVLEGDEQEVIVSVKRAHDGKSYSFSARYLNSFPLHSDSEDEPMIVTGWHDVKEHAEYDGWYSPLIDSSSGDEVTHWMPLPAAHRAKGLV